MGVFDDWFDDSETRKEHQRLFRSDAEQAFKAGMLAAAKIVEEKLDMTTASQYATSRECLAVRAEIEWLEDVIKDKAGRL